LKHRAELQTLMKHQIAHDDRARQVIGIILQYRRRELREHDHIRDPDHCNDRPLGVEPSLCGRGSIRHRQTAW
jgi:hypothetical protein